MRIYSGSSCFCDTGIPTGEVDMHGNELFSGDIVQLWHGNYIGEDCEEWMPVGGLTAIVGKQYTNYSNAPMGRNEGPTRSPLSPNTHNFRCKFSWSYRHQVSRLCRCTGAATIGSFQRDSHSTQSPASPNSAMRPQAAQRCAGRWSSQGR